ncbi:MAG: MBL fold metallo-hydrolase, partial [Myxococcales bacterium]
MPQALGVTDRIYLSEGLSNAWLVTTSDGRVVINTGMGFEAPVHKRNFDAVSKAPVRCVFLTQGHVDHVGGIDVFREPGTEIVAHANSRRQQAEDALLRPFRAARSGFAFARTVTEGIAAVAKEFEQIPAQAVAVPTITFDDVYALELGGVRFELYATPGGETTDSMIVWLPREQACFCGNLFGALFGHFPNFVTIRGDRYRDALTFIDSLDRVAALEPELLLVGHHQPVRGRERIRSELARLRAAVSHVHDATVRGMNEGKDVYTLMQEIRVPPECEVGEGYGKIAWGVRAIYETYAGWFQHRATTELYGVPPDRIAADLVELAGGAPVLNARARTKLKEGKVIDALCLAETVLSFDEKDEVGLDIAVQCHEMLMRDSTNFWLTSWLRHRHRNLAERRDAARGAIRIRDLAVPVLNDVQRVVLAAAENVNTDFDVEGVLDEARALTGLENFGAGEFRTRLCLLASEWDSDAGLTALGRAGLRKSLVRYAANRLLIQAALAEDATLRDEPVRAPVIVTGLPRTGTTHLV